MVPEIPKLDTWPKMEAFVKEHFPGADIEGFHAMWNKMKREALIKWRRSIVWLSREGLWDAYLVSVDDPTKKYDLFDCFVWSWRRRYRGKTVKVTLKRL